MKKTQVNNYIMLSLCSTILHFMLLPQTDMIFPRDRIIHVLISYVLFFILIHALQYADFSKGVLKYIITLTLAVRSVYIVHAFVRYFQTFYGSNTFAIIIFSITVAAMVYDLNDIKISNMYGFFLVLNIFMMIAIFALSIYKLNVANIYANNTDFSFSISKTYLFFDVISLAIVIPRGKGRLYAQKRYLSVSLIFVVIVTLIQGFCVRGNMLYSIPPLQSLFQIYSGNTIKRFDYYFAVIQTINYFAAIILYTNAIKKIYVVEKEDGYDKN
ncbi:MAG: hypothetical protein E7488_04555 [Ruminococcaceae bacterium]|nr:hypothetical protein [Oscillospiraceae bacterium]